MRNTKGNSGFTLIELLIVIAIIGILAAVLIPNLMNARNRAYDVAAQACAKEILTAAEIHNIDTPSGGYTGFTIPTNLNSCNDLTPTLTGTPNATTVEGSVTSQSQTVFNFSNSAGIERMP